MNNKFLKMAFAGLVLSVSGFANASIVTITFDEAVSGYTPTPGVLQDVTNEFVSLGVVFQDVLNPAFGVSLGKCGPGDGPVALFGHGNNGSCGDYTPNFNILFVDPNNSNESAYTTSFSVFNYDGLIKMTAFDANEVELGSTQLYSGLISLSGIGNISRINLLSLDQDPTTLDTISFESVTVNSVNVPEPSTLATLGLGLMGLAARRFKKQA